MANDELLNAIFQRVCTIGDQQERIMLSLEKMEALYDNLELRLYRVERDVEWLKKKIPE